MKNGSPLNGQGQDQNHFNEPKEGLEYNSTHPMDNLLTNINIGIKTRSFL